MTTNHTNLISDCASILSTVRNLLIHKINPHPTALPTISKLKILKIQIDFLQMNQN